MDVETDQEDPDVFLTFGDVLAQVVGLILSPATVTTTPSSSSTNMPSSPESNDSNTDSE